MLAKSGVDVLEEDIRNQKSTLLDLLLFDRSTRKNIIWAVNDYAGLGSAFAAKEEIRPELVTGVYARLIQPRITKTLADQENRTRDKAEVFTPCWICNTQNNLIDEAWFGRKNVFNTPRRNSWRRTSEKVTFSENKARSWMKYVDAKRLEISCGEAPYLVSRYDTVTGKKIPIRQRIGLLDRKLRIVNENAETESDWLKWATRAVQSVYGYEYQGDSLLLARENVFATFIDYYYDRYHALPEDSCLEYIARIISWNIWQMDGLKYVAPLSCVKKQTEDITLFGVKVTEEECPGCSRDDIHVHTGVYCRIMDWRSNESLRFVDMIKKGVRQFGA